MEKWSKRVAVVTGANSGIGFAILRKLALMKITVVGIDIKTDAIEKLKKELEYDVIHPYQCDVTQDRPTEDAFKWIDKIFGGVDILINNAGIIKNIGILEHDKPMSEISKVIDLNFTAVVRCARLAYKSMEARDSYGYIINMNSVRGHYIAPLTVVNVGVYPGTKYAVTATSEVIRLELIRKNNKKVRVTSVSPSLVSTNLLEAAEVHPTAQESLFSTCLKPEDVVNTVVHLLELPYTVNVSEITVRATGSTI
jgi:NADP+-dependent farnesol dehydrogenase